MKKNKHFQIFIYLIADKPDKPQNLQISGVDKDRVSLTWKPPRSDGGSEITKYVVEYREEGAFKWLRHTEDVLSTQCTIKRLQEKTVYEFHVAAENKAGLGPFCDPTAPVQAKEHVGELDICQDFNSI